MAKAGKVQAEQEQEKKQSVLDGTYALQKTFAGFKLIPSQAATDKFAKKGKHPNVDVYKPITDETTKCIEFKKVIKAKGGAWRALRKEALKGALYVGLTVGVMNGAVQDFVTQNGPAISDKIISMASAEPAPEVISLPMFAKAPRLETEHAGNTTTSIQKDSALVRAMNKALQNPKMDDDRAQDYTSVKMPKKICAGKELDVSLKDVREGAICYGGKEAQLVME